LNPEDAAMRTLAGKILLDRKDYKGAVEQLEIAVHLQPTLGRAHDLLQTAYLALGNNDKAAEQLTQIKQITTENVDSDHVMTSINRLLFSVRRQ
jgi:lipopolysaccharide biosynthesis regulator YciM